MKVLRGLKAIAKALGVADENTVYAYARRNRDPLPLIRWIGSVRIDADVLAKWKRRDATKGKRESDPALERVEGIIAIAACVGVTIPTLVSYGKRKRDPLPINGLGKRYPWIWRGALVDWVERQAIPWQVGDKKD